MPKPAMLAAVAVVLIAIMSVNTVLGGATKPAVTTTKPAVTTTKPADSQAAVTTTKPADSQAAVTTSKPASSALLIDLSLPLLAVAVLIVVGFLARLRASASSYGFSDPSQRWAFFVLLLLFIVFIVFWINRDSLAKYDLPLPLYVVAVLIVLSYGFSTTDSAPQWHSLAFFVLLLLLLVFLLNGSSLMGDLDADYK